jgi:hypothetical protein
MKPIETRAYGYRFRSRLEARWAVFFQTLGLQWEYEPEGFDLSPFGHYLPDFLVRGFPGYPEIMWVEVKPQKPEMSDVNKLRKLCCESGKYGVFAVGSDIFRKIIKETQEGEHDPWAGLCRPFVYLQVPHSTFSPLRNSKPVTAWWDTEEGIAFYKELDRLLDRYIHLQYHAAPLAAAAEAALSARFEHGEQP